jgi:hypothetical protein
MEVYLIYTHFIRNIGHKTRLLVISNYFVVDAFYFKAGLWDGGTRGMGMMGWQQE